MRPRRALSALSRIARRVVGVPKMWKSSANAKGMPPGECDAHSSLTYSRNTTKPSTKKEPPRTQTLAGALPTQTRRWRVVWMPMVDNTKGIWGGPSITNGRHAVGALGPGRTRGAAKGSRD